MNSRLPVRVKLDVVLVAIIVTAGLMINFYGANALYEKSRSLGITFTLESYLVLSFFVYKLFCLILVVRYIVCFFLYLKKRKMEAVLICLLFAILSGLSSWHLPFLKSSDTSRFNGFVTGVRENIDEQEFRDWMNDTLASIDEEGGISFERHELSFLSKNGLMACDGYIRKHDSKYYELRLFWGCALSGYYGLYVSNDPQKADYLEEMDVFLEVYEDVWAWSGD